MPPEQLTPEEEAELDAWLKALKGEPADRKNADAVALGELVRRTDQLPSWSDIEFAALQKRVIKETQTGRTRLRWPRWQPWALAATIGTLAVGVLLQQIPPTDSGSEYEGQVRSAPDTSNERSLRPETIEPEPAPVGVQTLTVGNVEGASEFIRDQLIAIGATPVLTRHTDERVSRIRITARIPAGIAAGSLSALKELGITVEPDTDLDVDVVFDG